MAFVHILNSPRLPAVDETVDKLFAKRRLFKAS